LGRDVNKIITNGGAKASRIDDLYDQESETDHRNNRTNQKIWDDRIRDAIKGWNQSVVDVAQGTETTPF